MHLWWRQASTDGTITRRVPPQISAALDQHDARLKKISDVINELNQIGEAL